MQNRAVPRGCSHSTSQIGSITAILILFLPLFLHITHMAGEGQQGGGHWSFTDISTPWELKCPFCGQCSTALAWKMKVDLVWLCQVSTCLSSIRAQFPTLSHGSSLPGGSSSCLVHSRVAPPRKISGSRTEHWLLKNTSGHREFPFPSVSLGKHSEIKQREAVWARALLWGTATLSFNLSTAEGLAELRGGPAPRPSCFTESQNHRITEAGKDP